MKKDIKALLKKKLTGKEVGNLILKEYIERRLALSDKELFTEAEIDIAISKLDTSAERFEYIKRCNISDFLDTLLERRAYGELYLSATFKDIYRLILSGRRIVCFFKRPEAIQISYNGYEAFKKDRLKAFYEQKKEITLLELILRKIKILHDDNDLKIVNLIGDYQKQPLTSKYKDFYKATRGLDYEIKELENFKIREDNIRDFVFNGQYKEALIEAINTADRVDGKNYYTGADLIYDSYEYWNWSDKSEATFKELLADYENILAYSLKVLTEQYFKGQQFKLTDALKISFNTADLATKYNFSFLPEAFNGQPVTLTKSGREWTREEEMSIKVTSEAGAIKPETFKGSIESYIEVLNTMENLNALIEVLAEDTGEPSIREAKIDMRTYKGNFLDICVAINEFYLELLDIQGKEEIQNTLTAFKELENIKEHKWIITDKLRKRADELLKSKEAFRDYQGELFHLFIRKG